jgi:16S rRNA (cytosine967-C5)-methyltransferase
VTPYLIGLAQGVVNAASREKPADALLREQLKSQGRLHPQDAADVTHAVFSYYRWLGWLDSKKTLDEKILQAARFALQFHEAPQRFPDAELVSRSVPQWIHEQMEVTAAWARALQSEPRLWLRARHGNGQRVAQILGHCNVFGSGKLSDTLEYTGHDDLFLTPEFHAGEFELQDLNSQAVGFVCAPNPGETWWDACAGEGGKLLHLSALMGNKGLIWASDRAEWRLRKLKRRTARAGVYNYRSVMWDGGPRLPTKTKFDGVLVDAPCAGVGTWQRNPHARWTTTPQDVAELGELQVRLLSHAASSLKPGGKLIYAVCTLTRGETVNVADALTKNLPELEPLAIADPLQRDSVAESSQLVLQPQDHGGNGMFIAAWRKAAA